MFVYYVFLKKTKKGNVLKNLLKSSVFMFRNIYEKYYATQKWRKSDSGYYVLK